MKYENHRFADFFPMMTAEELEVLTADIAQNGLRHPIVLFEGKILDGRNRLAACKKAEVEPQFVTHEGDEASAFDLVISENIARRDLTSSQRALSAARAMAEAPERRGGDHGNQHAGGKRQSGKNSHFASKSRDLFAQVFKVNDKYVQQAKAILSADDLVLKVENGTLGLAPAYEEYKEREKKVAKEKKDLERIGAWKPEYLELIESGKMSLEQTLTEHEAALREEAERDHHAAEARQLFFDGLRDLLDWVKDWVGGVTDDHLAWYAQDRETGENRQITREQISEAITQLERIATLTFPDHQDQGQKGRAGGRQRPAGRAAAEEGGRS
jgi:hypothetical protein